MLLIAGIHSNDIELHFSLKTTRMYSFNMQINIELKKNNN